MKQAQNQIYNAFKEAGLEKEARQLSKTIEDNEGRTKVVPALGHYIALMDFNLERDERLSEEEQVIEQNERHSDLRMLKYNEAKANILAYLPAIENSSQKGSILEILSKNAIGELYKHNLK